MKQQLNILTSLRFFAAFYVFLFHIDLRKPLDFLDRITHNIITQGAIGVNIFFILSGFILFYNYYDKKVSFNEFILRRLAKIYPVYFLGMLLCIAIVLVFQIQESYFTELIMMNILLVQSYLPAFSMNWYGAGSWSISTEFFFYLCFPFLLKCFHNISLRKTLILISISYLLSTTPGILHNKFNVNFFLTYSFPLARIPEFIIGILSAILLFKHKITIKTWIFPLIFLTGGGYYLSIGNKLEGYTIHNVLVIPIISLFLIVSPNIKGTLENLLTNSVLVYLGKISYGFYIMQIPLFIALSHLDNWDKYSSITLTLILFITNLILSVLSYHCVELPLHKLFLNKIKNTYK